MSTRHRLLQRQLKSCLGGDGAPPASLEALIEAVDRAYVQADSDRAMLERALELSSQELLQANSDMRAVVQAFPDVFLWLQCDGTITACRGRAVHDIMFPIDDLIGRRVHDLPCPRAAARLGAAVAEVNDGARLATVEYTLGRSGPERHFEARLLPLLEGQILAIIRDVTEQKAGELALARSVAMLQATLEATADGILVVDATGTIAGFNGKFLELWRIPEEIVQSRSDEKALQFVLDQLVDPEEFLSKVRELYSQPGAESFDQLHFRDGRIFERYSKPQLLDGRGVGRVWSFRDVTERRQAEEALRRSEEQLRQAHKMEAVGRLAGGVAHDFNNVLTAILGFSEVTLAHMSLHDPLRAKVEHITTAATRGTALTQKLLAFSRQQVITARPIDLATVVQNVLPMLERLIGEDIELTQVAASGPSTIVADPIQIEQAIMNLVINARDAMPHGGRLLIETRRVDLTEHDPQRHAEIAPGPYVMLAISDTGTGMTPDVQRRAFEPFFTTKDVNKGIGLGLAIVYGVVQQNHGHIALDSVPGQGTVVRIHFPLSRGAPCPSVDACCDHAPAAASGERVLLVEDDDQVRLLAREVLEGAGYALVEARNGEEALGLAERDAASFDLVLTDLVMPRCGGLELAKRILARRPQTRILIMSGYTNESVIREGVLNEGIPFVRKPFEPGALLRKVREVLESPVPGAALSRARAE